MKLSAITLSALAAGLAIASADASPMWEAPSLHSVSRGKGGKRAHRSVGTKAYQRKAAKARNVRRARMSA